MSTESLHQELTALRQRVFKLENAFSSASRSIKQQYQLWADFQRTKQNLGQLQQKFSFLVRCNPLGVICWNTAFEVTEWNPAAASIFGYDKFEALGVRAIATLVPENALISFQNTMSELVLQKQSTCSISENITKDGRTIVCQWHNTPLTDSEDKVIGVMSIVEDITPKKEMQIALNRSETRFQKLVANVPGMIYQFHMTPDGTMNFTYLSDACRDIYGIEPEEGVANYALIVAAIHPDDRRSLKKSIAISAQTLQTWDWEGRVCSHGKIKWVKGISRPELQEDGSIIWDGILIDVTERFEAQLALESANLELERRVEERTAQLRQQTSELEKTLKSLQHTQSQLIQSEKMSSLGQLVAGVAHEINNPVSFIYGNLNHLQQYTDDLVSLVNLYQKHYPNPVLEIQSQFEAIDLNFILSDLPKIYSSMKVGTVRIREIVTSLRTFSRLDEAELKQTEIHQGIDSTLMILEYRLKAHNPAIAVIKNYGNLPLVECYAGELNQVFMNVLANAIDAIEEKNTGDRETGLIHISTEVDRDRQVIIRIKDNGIGMTEEIRQRLFDPFYTTKPVGKGTGMGLSTSYQTICDRHKGTLECVSSPGKGAEFAIAIPIRQKV